MMKNFLTIFMLIFAVLASTALADPFRGNMLKEDITIGSGYDITGLGGASNIDMSATTGTITAHNLVVDNVASLGGLIVDGVIYNSTYIKNTFAVKDHSYLNKTNVTTLSSSGMIYSASTLKAAGVSSLNVTTVTALGASGAITAASTAKIGGTLTANAGVINTTMDINGATTTLGITTDAGSIITSDQYKRRATVSATNFTITDSGPDLYLVGNSTNTNSQTVTLPTAADNKGRIITIIEAVDPGTNTIVIDGEGSEQIDGAATKTTTDAVGSMYHIICNGVAWIKLASVGTWS